MSSGKVYLHFYIIYLFPNYIWLSTLYKQRKMYKLVLENNSMEQKQKRGKLFLFSYFFHRSLKCTCLNLNIVFLCLCVHTQKPFMQSYDVKSKSVRGNYVYSYTHKYYKEIGEHIFRNTASVFMHTFSVSEWGRQVLYS